MSNSTFDVFISYSHRDAEWVRDWLMPRLEAEGLRVCVDSRDFKIGAPSVVNMEEAVEQSRKTLLVLTPAWVESEWTRYESILTQTEDPSGLRRRTLPLMLEKCQPPRRISMLTHADFTDVSRREAELAAACAEKMLNQHQVIRGEIGDKENIALGLSNLAVVQLAVGELAKGVGLVWAYRSLCSLLTGDNLVAIDTARKAETLAKAEGKERDIIRAEWLVGYALIVGCGGLCLILLTAIM